MGFLPDDRVSPFGYRLRKLLAKRDMTAQQLAEKANISPAAISKYAAGLMSPRGETFEAIVKGLDLEATERRRLERIIERERHRPPMGNRAGASGGIRSSRTFMPMGRWVMKFGRIWENRLKHLLHEQQGWSIQHGVEKDMVRLETVISSGEGDKENPLVLLTHWEETLSEEDALKKINIVRFADSGVRRVFILRPFFEVAEVEWMEALDKAGGELVWEWNLIPAIQRFLPPQSTQKELSLSEKSKPGPDHLTAVKKVLKQTSRKEK